MKQQRVSLPRPIGALAPWALQLVMALERVFNDAQTKPLALAHKLPNDRASAAENGVMMFDPVTKKVVVSIDGEWKPLSN